MALKCPFMTQTLLDNTAFPTMIPDPDNPSGPSIPNTEPLLSDQIDDFYIENPYPYTNLDETKKIDLYNLFNHDDKEIRNIYVQYHDCIEGLCQLWDTTNLRCGALVSNTIINDPLDENHSMIQMLETILGKFSEKMAAANHKSILEFISHVHDSHRHPLYHYCDEIPVGCGGVVGGGNYISEASFAPTLVTEFISNQDLDHNGKIYGYYFKIRNSLDKPDVLNVIEKHANWVEPNIEVDWADMKAWAEDPQNVPDPVP